MIFVIYRGREDEGQSCAFLDILIPCWQRLFPCVSQRCTAILFAVLAARVLFWLFLCRRKDLCRQPFGIPVEHARDENAVTMEFWSRVGNTMPPPEFARQFHFLALLVSSTS